MVARVCENADYFLRVLKSGVVGLLSSRRQSLYMLSMFFILLYIPEMMGDWPENKSTTIDQNYFSSSNLGINFFTKGIINPYDIKDPFKIIFW